MDLKIQIYFVKLSSGARVSFRDCYLTLCLLMMPVKGDIS